MLKSDQRDIMSVFKRQHLSTHITPHLFTSNHWQVKYLYITNTECVYKYFSAVNTHLTWILKPCSWTKKDLLAERFRIPHLTMVRWRSPLQRDGSIRQSSHTSASLYTPVPYLLSFKEISNPSVDLASLSFSELLWYWKEKTRAPPLSVTSHG